MIDSNLNRDYDDKILTMPPRHPGEFMEELFVNRMNFSENYISKETNIPLMKIYNVISGAEDIDKEFATMLAKKFQKEAELLFRMQFVYSYFKENHIRPPKHLVRGVSLDI